MTESSQPPAAQAPQSMAFAAEATRGYLFAKLAEVTEEMKEQGIKQPEAALITGALEFAVQLWVQVGHGAGATRTNIKRNLELQTMQFFTKHFNACEAGARERRES